VRENAAPRPRTGWAYSNTNYILVGLVVQKVAGRPIGEEITHRITDRIGTGPTTDWTSV